VTFDYIPHSRYFLGSVNVHQAALALWHRRCALDTPCDCLAFSHDQPDNAARAMKLGIARSVPRLKYSADRVVADYVCLLEDSHYARTAADLGSTGSSRGR